MEILKKGISSNEVKIFKYLLGFSEIKMATPEFDDAFETAVKEFQKANNLTVDGIIGNEARQKIASKLPTTSTIKNRKSRETCALQVFFNLTEDGIFGSKTKAAVKDYQNQHNLSADGVVGPKTWSMLLTGASSSENKIDISKMKQPPNLKQYSKPWGPKMYSNHGDRKQTYANSACGVLSAVMVCRGLFDKDLGVEETGNLAIEKGYRTYNKGTSAGLFKYLASKYKSVKYQTTTSFENVVQCLQAGGLVIVCFGPGLNKKWTSSGHYCVIWKYDGQYVYINDPASTKAGREKATKADVVTCRKGFYCIYPKGG